MLTLTTVTKYRSDEANSHLSDKLDNFLIGEIETSTVEEFIFSLKSLTHTHLLLPLLRA